VLAAVPGQERNAGPPDITDGDRSGGITVRCVDLDLLDPFEERVEPRPPEDADGGAVQAVFPFEEPVEAGVEDFSVSFLPVPVSFFAPSLAPSPLAAEVDFARLSVL
jgi:hypothetical protein